MRNVKMTLCAIALAVTSGSALAATQGIVNFSGELIADTCQLDSGSTTVNVTLPTLSTQTLNASGIEAGSKVFEIKAVNCDASISKVAAHFEAIGGSPTDTVTGNLKNEATTGAAGNVQVRIYNSDMKQLRLGDTGQAAQVSGGEATMRYYGGYYSTEATTPGTVLAKAVFTLAYP